MRNLNFFVCIVNFFSCKQPDKTSNAYITRFYKNEGNLNNLIEALKKDTFIDYKPGQLIESAKFNKSIKKELNSINIDSLFIFLER